MAKTKIYQLKISKELHNDMRKAALQASSVDKKITMRDFIIDAIEEKLEREKEESKH